MRKDFFIRIDKRNVKITMSDILYVQAANVYVNIVTKQQVHMTLLTLRQLEGILPSEQFVRINRSYIIALDGIQSFDSATVTVAGEESMIGDNYLELLPSLLWIVQNDGRHQVSLGADVINMGNKVYQQTGSN